MPTAAEELLLKLGYSKFALDSEVVTEDMFDEIFELCDSTENDENEDPVIFRILYLLTDVKCFNSILTSSQFAADGNSSSSSSSFETKPTLSKTCN
ncbi:hypothetical protein B9Z55_022692 [Caenorhabditis nigoni]|uniref:Uncharacterized protein n=1 Tax=Caenorhabditis nigoni TaxID=1611254 RepID=A0A2G5SLS8_9PELO|nr:hypothetical protein B9Z55_022692 [Caenorhabditis nigoni]